MPTISISKLQRLNNVEITRVITALDVNNAVNRGEDLDSDSIIEDILYKWAGFAVEAIQQSVIEKGFNPAGTLSKFEPHIIDRAGVIKVLQLQAPDHWKWAEHGRKAGKRPPVISIEQWITYRGIDVKKVRLWSRTVKDKKGETHIVKPYKNITDTLKLRHIMAESIAVAIGRKGTIKRFGYKGSNFLSDVITPDELDKLSTELSRAVGYKVGVTIGQTI